MSWDETESVEEIRQDITCSQCKYNLRGLRAMPRSVRNVA